MAEGKNLLFTNFEESKALESFTTVFVSIKNLQFQCICDVSMFSDLSKVKSFM